MEATPEEATHTILTLVARRIEYYEFVARTGSIDPDDVPKHDREARAHKDKISWILAENIELEKMDQMGVYELVPRPKGKNVMATKMSYKIKIDANGLATQYKARYVCKGFSGRYGQDYTQTFSPTPEPKTFKLLLSLMAQGDEWEATQCDVSAAFLNSDVLNEVYCEQPMFRKAFGKEDYVWKLKKQLYGMKNSSLAWHNDLKATLIKIGFKQSQSEPCLFTFRRASTVCHLIVHVDDIMFVHNNRLLHRELFEALQKKYKFSASGPLSWYLGMKVEREKSTGDILLSQTAYIDTLLRRFDRFLSKSTAIKETPWLVGQQGKLSLEMSPKTEEETKDALTLPYAEAIGGLQWLVSCTRPDIAYAVSLVSRYLGCYGQQHWAAVVRILEYLRSTRDLPMRFSKSPAGMLLESFADSDWAGDQDHRRSQGGCMVFVGGNLVSCKSILQRIVALSSMEAEYIAACEAAKEVIWFRRVLEDLGFPQGGPTTIWEDNRSAICFSENPHDHSRSKHIDVRYHFLRQHTMDFKTIVLRAIGTKEQLADMLTKNTDTLTFVKHRNKAFHVK